MSGDAVVISGRCAEPLLHQLKGFIKDRVDHLGEFRKSRLKRLCVTCRGMMPRHARSESDVVHWAGRVGGRSAISVNLFEIHWHAAVPEIIAKSIAARHGCDVPGYAVCPGSDGGDGAAVL